MPIYSNLLETVSVFAGGEFAKHVHADGDGAERQRH